MEWETVPLGHLQDHQLSMMTYRCYRFGIPHRGCRNHVPHALADLATSTFNFCSRLIRAVMTCEV